MTIDSSLAQESIVHCQLSIVHSQLFFGGDSMERIIELINKENLTKDERLELLDELYWADWTTLSAEYPDELNKVFQFLRNTEFNEEEISLIIKLYSNPDGAYVEEFSYIIRKIYNEDKIKFMKALHLNIEEGENLAYLFRNDKVFEDGDAELQSILATKKLTEEEETSANAFFRTYKNVCNT